MKDAFHRWPLLVVGIVLIGWSVKLTIDSGDSHDARVLLTGIGCVMLGAGLAVVFMYPHDDDDKSND